MDPDISSAQPGVTTCDFLPIYTRTAALFYKSGDNSGAADRLGAAYAPNIGLAPTPAVPMNLHHEASFPLASTSQNDSVCHGAVVRVCQMDKPSYV